MILTAIDMQGFKSFPDKITLKLGKGITGVVGPNGSGKSNISDAVRWVLGEQSTKALRGAKMEDVIFGGTDKRKALGFAEVTLHLDNKDRSLNIDKDDVSVTRRYYRSGESEYRINGEDSRLRDVHELFMDTGLGRDGYSMVSQGRIADLVSARSTQRRDMLEEAAGISHYRYRRAGALRQLEHAEENLALLRVRLEDLEARIGPLKTQSEKAKKYLTLSEEKKTLEIGLWLHTIEKSGRDLQDKESKLAIANAQYEEVEKKLEGIETGIEEIAEQRQGITVQIESLTKSIADSQEQATAIDGEIAVKKNTIEHNLSTIERISADMGDGAKTVAETQEQIDSAQAEIEEKQKQIEERKETLASELEKLNSLLEKNSENSDKVREVNEKLTAAAVRLSEINVEKSSAESAIAEMEERIGAIDELLSTRSGITDELEGEIAEADTEIRRLKDEESENENALDGFRMIIETREGKAQKLHEEIDQLNLDIYQKNARIKMLDDLEKNLDGYAGSVQKVIKESQRGALRGIRGTLSQLISTKGEYSVAVEIALGAAIQNIVVDDENAAKKAIEFLKNNRAGRATFLPLTSVKAKPFTEKDLEKCEGYIDMAHSLVECDKKYSEIIASLLGRTAVVDNIDNGIAMAKKYQYRFKIVTLDGQVLNAGGSMTGGSKGSGTGFLSRINEIEELREDVKVLQGRLDEKTKKVEGLDGEMATARAQLDASEAEIIKIQEALIRAESEKTLLTERLETAKGHIAELLAEKERSAARIKDAKENIKKSEKESLALGKENDELNASLDELDGQREELEALREKSAEIQHNLNLDILALNKEIEACRAVIEAAEISKEALASRSGKLIEEIEQLKAENESIEEEIKALEEQAQALRDGAGDTQEKIEELTASRNGTEADTVRLHNEERELNSEKEKLSGEIARLDEKKTAIETTLETTKNKLLDEYQLSFYEAQEVGEIPEDIGAAQKTLNEIRNKIRALGPVNPGSIEEYQEVSEQYEFFSTQLTDVEDSKKKTEKLIAELTEKMAEKFREQFRLINNAFGETFRDLFSGGKAELVLDDPQDVLECNINIKVQPPGKNVQNIDLLSGGEKGLAAIALLFAILKINPAPFCIFDEVEAALDDVNVSRYARYVRNMTSSTQFILITHRRGTMEEADVLYGITMQEEGVSKMLELKSYEMVKKLGLDQ
jgi:chromosome segregation protein